MTSQKNAFFLSCDWGTTHFRLRLADRHTGAIRDEIKTPEGAARLAETAPGPQREERYAQCLAAHAATLLARNSAAAADCLVSGMATSRIGWKELPYAPLPQPLDGSALLSETLQLPLPDHPPLRVRLISGVRDEENVMRGEETELLGLAQKLPYLSDAEALLLMPGTHSKHVRISGGKIIGFDTLMTGELFAHLPSAPTLREALQSADRFDASSPSFAQGVHEASTPGFFKTLFKIRARRLLDGATPTEGAARLSGLLIGAELLQISATPGLRILLAAGGSLGALYRQAANALGLANIESVPTGLMEEAATQGHLRLLN